MVSGKHSARIPNHQMVKRLLDNTFRTVADADALFDVPRTARPHSMKVVLEQRPT